MKYISLTLLFICLALSLSAQTGLFDITYGDSLENQEENLENWDYPLFLYEIDEHIAYFLPYDNDWVDSIALVLGEDKSTIVGWVIYYYPQEDQDIIEAVLEPAEYYHGSDYSYFEEDDIYHWDLGGSRSLSLGYDDDGMLKAVYFDYEYEAYFP